MINIVYTKLIISNTIELDARFPLFVLHTPFHFHNQIYKSKKCTPFLFSFLFPNTFYRENSIKYKIHKPKFAAPPPQKKNILIPIHNC